MAMREGRLFGAFAAPVAGAALAAALALPGAGAAPRVSTIPGIVDIYTNLGYQSARAAGTGIVLTSSGEILTNNHVIRGATTIRVVDLDNGRSYQAAVVGYTVSEDVAVLQLNSASGLQAAPLGNSSTARVGDNVTTLGNAGGAGGTPYVANGTIVGLNQPITARDDSGDTETLHGLIKTNAQLQPGDSGGPMVDSAGQVIGIDTAASNSFTFVSSSSQGFAIPINTATAIAAQIFAGHASSTIHVGPTAFLGLSLATPDSFYGQQAAGLTVAQVVPGSPSEKIGIAAYDVITRFDGRAVSTPASLTALVVTKAPGDTVQVRWVDTSGTPHVASLRLAAGPPQ
jgi:S1-C subfamily serine protease